ncbi:MAG: hypothetical protein ACP5N3_04070 [Candidatus Nanoarchaeia archaeon]
MVGPKFKIKPKEPLEKLLKQNKFVHFVEANYEQKHLFDKDNYDVDIIFKEKFLIVPNIKLNYKNKYLFDIRNQLREWYDSLVKDLKLDEIHKYSMSYSGHKNVFSRFNECSYPDADDWSTGILPANIVYNRDVAIINAHLEYDSHKIVDSSVSEVKFESVENIFEKEFSKKNLVYEVELQTEIIILPFSLKELKSHDFLKILKLPLAKPFLIRKNATLYNWDFFIKKYPEFTLEDVNKDTYYF